jgi:site-specific DNA-methyltransferase (adenine-specific)
MNDLMNRLNLMDCMEGMSKFPDKYFELAIVDPPYGIGVNKFGNGRRKGAVLNYKIKGDWDNQSPDDSYFKELFRISENQIIWGANNFRLPISQAWIFWDKGISNEVSFASGELAWTSFKNKTLKKVYVLNSGNAGQANLKRIHPTQKPIALYRWLLQNYAKKGDKILDTHVGSGSSLIAGWEEGFEDCGFELDEDYYKAACNRIEQVQAQGKLFATV